MVPILKISMLIIHMLSILWWGNMSGLYHDKLIQEEGSSFAYLPHLQPKLIPWNSWTYAFAMSLDSLYVQCLLAITIFDD